MSLKVKLLSGLPASGKTTYAKELIKKDPSYGRINRDDIRQMVFGGKWTPYNEKITIGIEQAIARVLLEHNRHVVVDDTNLTNKHDVLWESFAAAEQCFGQNFGKEITSEKMFFDVPVEECVRRDRLRQLQGYPYVGRNVIVKMAARNGLLKWPDAPIVLVDIDGTLADGSHREHLVHGDKKNWEAYYSLLGKDKPVFAVFKWVAELAKTHTIVIVSGRGAENEYKTLDWFEKVWSPNPLFPELEVPRFPVFQYFFRNAGDRRPDDQVKLEVLDLLPTKPVMVIDDRPSVIRAWRTKGLKVIPVRGSVEEF